MRRTAWICFLLATFLLPSAAKSQADRFQPGQRVVQVSTKATGTVTAVNAEKKQVQVRFDDRPANEAGAWFFWGTPDLEPSTSPPPTALPARPSGQAALAVLRPTKPPEAQPEAKAYEPIAPLSGLLDESIVKRLVEDSLRRPVDQRVENVTFGWNAVSIAAPRRLGTFEADSFGIPTGTEVFPVKADFNYTVASLKSPGEGRTTDRVGFAYFYLDAFKHWAFTWYAHSGTVNAPRRK